MYIDIINKINEDKSKFDKCFLNLKKHQRPIFDLKRYLNDKLKYDKDFVIKYFIHTIMDNIFDPNPKKVNECLNLVPEIRNIKSKLYDKKNNLTFFQCLLLNVTSSYWIDENIELFNSTYQSLDGFGKNNKEDTLIMLERIGNDWTSYFCGRYCEPYFIETFIKNKIKNGLRFKISQENKDLWYNKLYNIYYIIDDTNIKEESIFKFFVNDSHKEEIRIKSVNYFDNVIKPLFNLMIIE